MPLSLGMVASAGAAAPGFEGWAGPTPIIKGRGTINYTSSNATTAYSCGFGGTAELNDIIILVAYHEGTTGTAVTEATGYTLAGENYVQDNIKMEVWWKRATGGEVAVAGTKAASINLTLAAMLITGCDDLGSPFNVEPQGIGQVAGTGRLTIAAADLPTTVPNCLVIGACMWDISTGSARVQSVTTNLDNFETMYDQNGANTAFGFGLYRFLAPEPDTYDTVYNIQSMTGAETLSVMMVLSPIIREEEPPVFREPTTGYYNVRTASEPYFGFFFVSPPSFELYFGESFGERGGTYADPYPPVEGTEIFDDTVPDFFTIDPQWTYIVGPVQVGAPFDAYKVARKRYLTHTLREPFSLATFIADETGMQQGTDFDPELGWDWWAMWKGTTIWTLPFRAFAHGQADNTLLATIDGWDYYFDSANQGVWRQNAGSTIIT